jgi:putative aminopeptidase FrvX
MICHTDTLETIGRGEVKLGQGCVLTSFLYVSGLNGWHAHPGLRAQLKHIAAQTNIPYQQDAARGLMSDARVVTWLAIPSAVVGIPMRGKHSSQEIIDLQDLASAANLLLATVRSPLPDLRRG